MNGRWNANNKTQTIQLDKQNKTKTVFIKKRTGNVKTISVTANVQHNRLVVQMSVYNGKCKIYMRC